MLHVSPARLLAFGSILSAAGCSLLVGTSDVQRRAEGDATARDGASGSEAAADGDAAAMSTSPSVTRGLLAQWQFEEPGGDGVIDSTAAHHDGVLVAGTNGKPSRVPGKRGQALSFAGGSYVEVASRLDVSATMTLTFWANTQVDGSAQPRLFSHGGNGGYAVKLNGPFMQMTVAGSTSAMADYALPVGQWHHYAMVFESKVTWYVDGALVANRSDTLAGTEKIAIDATPFRIGISGAADSPYTGLIDDARLYSVALSPAEVAAIAGEP